MECQKKCFRSNDFQQVISRIYKELRCCYCGVGLSHECCNTWYINNMLAHCVSEIQLSKDVKFLFWRFSRKRRFNQYTLSVIFPTYREPPSWCFSCLIAQSDRATGNTKYSLALLSAVIQLVEDWPLPLKVWFSLISKNLVFSPSPTTFVQIDKLLLVVRCITTIWYYQIPKACGLQEIWLRIFEALKYVPRQNASKSLENKRFAWLLWSSFLHRSRKQIRCSLHIR